ncbi:M16 family metallopeptidase [Gilvimarinus xylanilyticus]|uniref:Insulinase family protein n=1 Tax=Gilvimarinus xylanilyticus TaxID=2944139 RepID=A0A9X2KUU1_9GAMM|nr:pitrilysin family protein [Gilvimarinus xylanilyticus]MCP8900552.1 insulinase family protein [Gilvimarinus xylanilyticus]
MRPSRIADIRPVFTVLLTFISTLLITSCQSNVQDDSANAAQNAPIEKITSVEGITEYRLANGLQVLLFPDPTKENITVNVTYHVGSKHENYGETGMAHLLEHLLFKGSTNHPNIPDEMSQRGAQSNGTTWLDRTNYFETFSANDDNLDWALSMESDRMVNSFVSAEDLESEMTVVYNELQRAENSPFHVTMQKLRSSAFLWHNYGNHTLGARSDLEHVSIEKLRAFYEMYYQPDNATLIVAGKIDSAKALDKIQQHFGGIAKPERSLPEMYTREPASDGERSVTVRRVGDTPLAMVGYHTPPAAHSDSAALAVLANILTDQPRGRLHKALVEPGIAARTGAWLDAKADSSMFMGFTLLNADQSLEAAEQALLQQLEGFAQTPVTPEELERAKLTILNGFEKSMEQPQAIAIQLSDWLTNGDWRLLFLFRDRIEQVSLEDVQRVAGDYLQRNNRTLGRFIPTEKPERVELPEVESIDAMLEGYTGRKDIVIGEAFDPSWENIAARTEFFTLGDNIRVAALKKNTRGESVRLNIQFNYGSLESLTGKAQYAGIVGDMLGRGSKQYSREEMKSAFDRIQTYGGFGANAGGGWAWLASNRDNLVPALGIIAEGLKNPTFPQEELNQLLQQAQASVESSLSQPQALASNFAHRRITPVAQDHPQYVRTFDEQLALYQNVERQQLVDYHREFFGADNMLVTIVGDYDRDQVVKALEKHFADWTTGNSYEPIVLGYQPIDTSDKIIDTPDKENGSFFAINLYDLDARDEDAPELVLGNYLFGGGFINSRLATRLRQQEGWSYGVGSSLNPNRIQPRTVFWGWAIGGPENLNNIERGFKEELQKVLDEGFTEQEVENGISGILQSNKVQRADDEKLAQMLQQMMFYNETLEQHQAFEADIADSNKEDVLRVMKEYLSPEDMLYIKAGDMNKARTDAQASGAE